MLMIDAILSVVAESEKSRGLSGGAGGGRGVDSAPDVGNPLRPQD